MNRARSELDVRVIAPYVLVSFCLFWLSDTVADPDLWGHIRFGRDILRTGSIVQSDTYSYQTNGQAWVNHEWLSEVILAVIYDWSGSRGLILFKVAAGLLIVGLCYAHLRQSGLGPLRSTLLVSVVILTLRGGLGIIRPQIFTYILFIALLLLIEGTKERLTYRLWVLPILFALWVNLHGGVLAGIGVLGLWIVGRIVEQVRDETTSSVRNLQVIAQFGLLAAACGLALLLNPYGAELVRFLLRTATGLRPEIAEWRPLPLTSLIGLFYLGLLALGIFGLVGSRRPRRLESVLLFCVMAVLPLIAMRHYPLFVFTLVAMTGEHIADAAERCLRPSWLCLGQSRGIAVIGVVLAVILGFHSSSRFRSIRLDPDIFPFPVRAVALLEQSNVRGNLAVFFDWGEFALWHLGPGVKVSIDGRRETVYSEEVYRQSWAFQQGTGDWDRLLETTATDLVLVPRGSATSNLLAERGGWFRLYEDTLCSLFVREELPIRGQLERTVVPNSPADGRGLRFPG